MAAIIIIEIQNDLIDTSSIYSIEESLIFFKIFDEKSLFIFFEKRVDIVNAFLSDFKKNEPMIESYELNMIAKNRLIHNFMEERPDLALIIMDCSNESKIFKIRKKNVK